MSGPKRIVCLTEETTEWLYLLGEQDRIVGITAYTERPAVAKLNHPVVSGFITGNISKIKELKPDLIIGFSDIQADFSKKLIECGLNVLITNQRSLDEIFETMELVAHLVGQPLKGGELIDSMRTTLDDHRSKHEKYSERPKVFFQEWNDPIICGIRWVSELIESVGGIDCFKEKSRGGLAKDRIVSGDDIVDQNPDLIIGSWCGKPVDFNWIRNQKHWEKISALQNHALYEIDPSIILQPGPALFLAGIQKLDAIISPWLHKMERP